MPRRLTKPQQIVWRRKLIAADAHAGYDDAKHDLPRLVQELEKSNGSAARSFEEGLDETLTLHRLQVPEELRTSFHTTNLIESVMACLERHTRRVTHWRTSDQKQRWVAGNALKVEGQFRRVPGFNATGLSNGGCCCRAEAALPVLSASVSCVCCALDQTTV